MAGNTLLSIADDDVQQVSPKVVLSTVRSFYIGTLLSCVLLTVLVYDHVCTLDKEIKYFWRLRMGITKVVFFTNRYVGIIGALAHIIGRAFSWLPSLSYAISIISIDYVLMIRTLALYHQNRRMKIALWILLITDGTIKLMAAIASSVFDKAILVALSPTRTSCLFLGIKRVPEWIYTLNWMVPCAFGLMLMVLALRKATEFWKLNGVYGSRLVRILITDQIIYFMLAVSCSVISLVGNRFVKGNAVMVSTLNALGSPTLQCVLGSRLFFNLKEAGERGVNEGTNWASYTMTGMDFSISVDNAQLPVWDRDGSGQSSTIVQEEPDKPEMRFAKP